MFRHQRVLSTVLQCARQQQQSPSETYGAATSFAQQLRAHGGGVPEFWGRPSSYTEGTDFLGTPKNHLDLAAKRPLSPHVVELDNKSLHYKMPYGALSSIMNRVTGVGLTAGFTAASYVALTGDLPGALLALKTNYPLLLFPAKFAISFPIIYHFLGGMRHFVWDLAKIGNQAERNSLLETPTVELSSQILLGSGLALSFITALL